MSSSLNIDIEQFKRYDVVLTPQESTNDPRIRIVHRVFAVAVVLVAATSIYDAFLVFHFRVAIQEQNPFCEWLISLEPEYVSVFLLSKGLGTLGVVAILLGLFKYWRRAAIPVAVSLVVFQAGLMSYLYGTDGRRKPIRGLAMTTPQFQQSPLDPTSISKRTSRDLRPGKAAPRRGRRARARRLAERRQMLDTKSESMPRQRNQRDQGHRHGRVVTIGGE